ncbi:MAG TPA: hypothetical protein VGZ90_05385 [Puia sp.]|jgi:hypothetical protein|nr:hypothetical protein [Puia sp.]
MKKLFFSVFAFCLSSFAFSQTFMHGVGVNTFIQSASGYSTQVVGGLTYSPRINFMETDNTSLSVGIPMSIGVSASASTYGSNSAALMFDAPLVLNFNYGAGSSKETESRFGFFGGAGFGYHTSEDSYSDGYNNYTDKMSGFGPVGNAGIRIGVGSGSHNIEIRLSYMKTLDTSKSSIFGIGGLFNF